MKRPHRFRRTQPDKPDLSEGGIALRKLDLPSLSDEQWERALEIIYDWECEKDASEVELISLLYPVLSCSKSSSR